jgi:hydrogenase maturation protease
MNQRILIAGIGNIFLGDDAFGVEVARQLRERHFPSEVRVEDFGIRVYDLAYALVDGYDSAILVDAAPREQEPGTVFLIEPDWKTGAAAENEPVNGHSLNPVSVLQMAQSLGTLPRHVYLVGCEPHILESEDGHIGLSPKVQTAVPNALAVIESLLAELFQNHVPGLVEA